MNWTEDQLTAYMAKRHQADRQVSGSSVEVPDDGPELRLQARCLQYCQERGWPTWHDWSRKRNQPGWPDLIVFQSEGRVRLVELKSASGKLRAEQHALKRQFLFLGHEVRVVKSFKRFCEVVG